MKTRRTKTNTQNEPLLFPALLLWYRSGVSGVPKPPAAALRTDSSGYVKSRNSSPFVVNSQVVTALRPIHKVQGTSSLVVVFKSSAKNLAEVCTGCS